MVGFDQWQDWHDQQQVFLQNLKNLEKQSQLNKKNDHPVSSPKNNNSGKIQKQLTEVEKKIEAIEKQLSMWTSESVKAETTQDPAKLNHVMSHLASTQSQLDELLKQWEDLQAKQS
jgi:hypothetical protein